MSSSSTRANSSPTGKEALAISSKTGCSKASPYSTQCPGWPEGGTVLDPEVVARLLGRHSRSQPLARLSPREREVLTLMAEGRSNAAIAQRLVVSERAVAKHTSGIFTKLDLPPSDDDNRRVLAVLAYFER